MGDNHLIRALRGGFLCRHDRCDFLHSRRFCSHCRRGRFRLCHHDGGGGGRRQAFWIAAGRGRGLACGRIGAEPFTVHTGDQPIRVFRAARGVTIKLFGNYHFITRGFHHLDLLIERADILVCFAVERREVERVVAHFLFREIHAGIFQRLTGFARQPVDQGKRLTMLCCGCRIVSNRFQ